MAFHSPSLQVHRPPEDSNIGSSSGAVCYTPWGLPLPPTDGLRPGMDGHGVRWFAPRSRHPGISYCSTHSPPFSGTPVIVTVPSARASVRVSHVTRAKILDVQEGSERPGRGDKKTPSPPPSSLKTPNWSRRVPGAAGGCGR